MDTNSSLPLLQLLLSQEDSANTILTGDFNLHLCLTHHTDSERLLRIIESSRLELHTPAGAVTWSARDTQSTIDLAFTSTTLSPHVLRCAVQKQLDHGSDHWPTLLTLDFQGNTDPQRPRRLWKHLNHEKYHQSLS